MRPNTVSGYTSAPYNAWSGWRLRIPGGPIGGQYHGFIAPDSLGWPAGPAEIYRTSGDPTGLGFFGDDAAPPEHDRCADLWHRYITANPAHPGRWGEFLEVYPQCGRGHDHDPMPPVHRPPVVNPPLFPVTTPPIALLHGDGSPHDRCADLWHRYTTAHPAHPGRWGEFLEVYPQCGRGHDHDPMPPVMMMPPVTGMHGVDPATELECRRALWEDWQKVHPPSARSWQAFLEHYGACHSAAPGMHGYPEWGGIAHTEGESLSDHVYRSTAEMRPRPNASGGAHTVSSEQTQRSGGFSVAPGNYYGIGGLGDDMWWISHNGGSTSGAGGGGGGGGVNVSSSGMDASYGGPAWGPATGKGASASGFQHGMVRQSGNGVATAGPMRPAFPNYRIVTPGWAGGSPAQNVVLQSPPPLFPAPSPTVANTSVLPVSPQPSPVVAASPQDYLPAQGQPLPAPAGTPAPALSWFDQSTVWAGVPNWEVALGGALVAFLLLRKK